MKLSRVLVLSPAFLGAGFLTDTAAAGLPGDYFRLLEAGTAMVAERMAAEPGADLATLTQTVPRQAWTMQWRRFPCLCS